nr:microfibril-associated glycoprotein 4 [Crassostrea gigas]
MANLDIFRSLCDSDTDSDGGDTDIESPFDYDSETSKDGNDENDDIPPTWKADFREIDVPPCLCTTGHKHDLGQDGNLTATVWMDTRPVAILATNSSPLQESAPVSRRLKNGSTVVVRRPCYNDSPADCTFLHNINCGLTSGIYRIKLPFLGHVTAFCDMEIDGGGWTVFQKRQDGSEDFYRTWTEYKNGFGNLRSEFWLGNEKLHHLLSQGTYEMRMDMEDFDNQTRYVKYTSFYVGDESSKYTVTLTGFSGNVGDCFTNATINRVMNSMMFSTWDQDNDVTTHNCAVIHKSGWWHRSCNCANPNGLYLAGETTLYNQGVTYHPWRDKYYSLKSTRLMVRRVA